MRPRVAAHALGAIGLSVLAAAASPVAGAHGARQVGGVIRGRVTLTGPAPANPVIRMGADPACSRAYGDARPTHDFVVRDATGGLAHVFVEVRGAFPDTPVPTTPVVLDQRGCMFHPRVVAMRRGQVLEVRNGDPTMHNLHSLSSAGNTFNVSQVVGRPPFRVTLDRAERMLRVTCDVHRWMNVYVAVVEHPYFAVTPADGRFEIRGVPPGRHAVHVWHERYGPLSATVDVAAGGTATADFAYAGSEKAAPPP